MKADIKYWQADTEVIAIEAQTGKGQTALVETFPLYDTGKRFDAYVASNGALRWEFPVNSSELESFLNNAPCTTEQIA
ncbi:MAG: hypothetical protein HC824_15755 [Synechococcales cyanobacterium RM1_1_8]|jgi:hypothetical protein|nr:hypothetical protein [Synechococcales cyanobacterium RM1_1_8]